MKSPLPALELRPGQLADINTLLSLVEDIIRKQNRAGGDFYSDVSKKEGSMILTLGAVNLQGIVQGIDKRPSICAAFKSFSVHSNHYIRLKCRCIYNELELPI